ncbi:hypothetical protein MOKP104_37130 [Mycobacterium avium subsp. hominissuis]
MLADRGLAQVQGGGSPVEAAAVGDGDEAAQRRDVQHLTHGQQFNPIRYLNQSAVFVRRITAYGCSADK